MVSEWLGAGFSGEDGGLNPCFSGGWSRRVGGVEVKNIATLSLNPCFSGGWSRRGVSPPTSLRQRHVLILVLVEDGLGGQRREYTSVCGPVLILVLVEDGLGEASVKLI